MVKLGFFWYSKIDIFAHTVRKGQLWFDWYLEVSKTGNDRVNSSQKINKKFLETISKLKKRLLELTLPGHRSSQTGKSRLAFKPFGFSFLCISLPFVSFGVWLLAGEVLFWFGFVGLVWVHRHLEQTTWANMGIAHCKVPDSIWEPLGKKEKKNLMGQSIAVIQWQEKWPKNLRSLLM